MPNKKNCPKTAAVEEPTVDAQPIELSAEAYEEFIAASPTDIERLVMMLLVDELYKAQRLQSESDEQVELLTGDHAVTQFLHLSLWAFGSGFQRFSGYGELIRLRREGLLLEDEPALREAVLAKLEECRPVVEDVVRRFSPILNDPNAAPRSVRKLARS